MSKKGYAVIHIKRRIRVIFILVIMILLSIFLIIKQQSQENLTAQELSVNQQRVVGKQDGDHPETSDWNLILVNKTHPLPEDFTVSCTQVSEGQYADSRCAPELLAMMDAAKKDGCPLYVASSYRSLQRQETLFNQEVNSYIASGMSEEAAAEEAAVLQAPPGTSEHGTGLAFDIVGNSWFSENSNLNEGFADTKESDWLLEHAQEYGFVLRYPEDKQDITGYGYEPWHFRYVGVENATIMREKNLCLEEYLLTLDN